jgi:hypothetical protein
MDADKTASVNNVAFNARSLDPLCLAQLRSSGGDLLVMRLVAVNVWCYRCCTWAQAGKLGRVLES